jgi:glycosyltransferase involved in cell wall biosynthesis
MGEKSRAIALKKYDVRKVSPTVIKAMGLDPADHRLPKKNSGPKRLRIVVLGSKADSLVRFRGHLLKSLVDMGHEVYACAPDENETISKRLMALGVRYRKIILERTGVNPFADLRTIINLYREFRRISPDIFLGYTIKPVIYGSIAAKLSGIDHIHSMITGLGYAFSETGRRSRIVGALVRGLYKLILSYNECVFFQNPDDRQLFVDRRLVHESQVRLINGSGVDISEFSPKPFPQQVSFLLIARLIRDKGIVEFVSAAKILKARHPKARVRLVGVFDKNPSAISRDEVDQWVSAGYIEFLGYLDDVRPAIADSSVFVLPTFYREGTPRTVLEAMAMGRPIVTTDAPGCRETVEEGKNGFLVPVHNIDSLVNAMEKFLVQPDLVYKFGKVSRQIALVKYDVRNVTRDIIDGIGVRSTGTAQQENQEAKAI